MSPVTMLTNDPAGLSARCCSAVGVGVGPLPNKLLSSVPGVPLPAPRGMDARPMGDGLPCRIVGSVAVSSKSRAATEEKSFALRPRRTRSGAFGGQFGGDGDVAGTACSGPSRTVRNSSSTSSLSNSISSSVTGERLPADMVAHWIVARAGAAAVGTV